MRRSGRIGALGHDGLTETGAITGAGSFDLHEHIAIRTGPLGAYTDNLHAHLWIRTLLAVGVDGRSSKSRS